MYIRLYSPSRFEWDIRKSEATRAARGFDFSFARRVFDGPTLERVDDREDYGETRTIAIGVADGVLLTVVYTDRVELGEIIRRIISARRSNAHERQTYQKAIEEAQSEPG
jgi:uncharacterized DUF497 family protein